MELPAPAEDILNELGLNSVISAAGTTTAYGGSRLRPEVMDAMNRASNTMVNIDALNGAAGKILAEYSGAEAGLVTSGAAGGLVLQAAAVIAGSAPCRSFVGPRSDRSLGDPHLVDLVGPVGESRPPGVLVHVG